MTSATEGGTPLVIGVGNRDRGDDGIGPFVADAIRAGADGVIESTVIEGDLSDLCLSWHRDQAVAIVDAMVSGREPGAIEVLNGLEIEFGPEGRPLSSHGVGLADAIALARVLGRLPQALTVVLVEGASFAHLDPLSDPVHAAGLEVADRLPHLLRARSVPLTFPSQLSTAKISEVDPGISLCTHRNT